MQRGTEIGACGFWAFASRAQPDHLTGERQEKRLARWGAIVKTAAEQSHRAILPSLHVEGSFADVLAQPLDFDLALLAVSQASRTIPCRSAFWQLSPRAPGRILVVIGPESGLTTREVQAARKAGAQVVSLGPRILRTETAAMVMVVSDSVRVRSD